MHLHLLTIHATPSPQAVPLAAASLKAYLDSRPELAPLRVTLAEYFSGTPADRVCREVLESGAAVVALPLYLWNREECCSLAAMLRREAPELILLAGGPEATADPEGVLREGPFDLVVIGEGELTLAEIMERLQRGLPLSEVPGTAGAGGARCIPRPPIPDLAVLPSPWLTGVLDAHIANGVVWQLSRGCSFGCDFCFDGMGDRKVRRYPMERLERELEYFLERGVS
ncbi:MAG TPA: cobalamin-dependent protein, partial [Verrucomicrobiae bacterium]|nr:cobalamin-dependent protein [Verrucomicrobiae bacterium]